MAEIAIITPFISKLASLLEERWQLHQSVHSDVRSIIAEMKHIQAFLRIADTPSANNNRLHEIWVEELRDVAHQSENIIDEYTFHFPIEGQNLCYSCLSFGAQHDIALEVRSIKSSFEEVYQRNKRYLKYQNGIFERSPSLTVTRHYNPQEAAHFLMEKELVGIGERKKKLIEMLLAGNSTHEVVSVFGMGGLGKTTLVKMVYDDAGVMKRFQRHAWVTVSHSYILEDLLKDLIHKLHKENITALGDSGYRRESYAMKMQLDEIHRNMSCLDLKKEVRKILVNQSYVIIVDDLWTYDAWDDIKDAFPPTDNHSRVVVTTRNLEVARYACISIDQLYSLNRLSEHESWVLYCQKSFLDNHCPAHLIEVSRSILKKCDGLPLAIAVIGGLLIRKDATRERCEWDRINQNVGLDGIQKILSLSYDDLPDHLRPCYLYLSIFPEDHMIRPNRLAALWIAEGFVQEGGDGLSLEDVSESYISELINRSMVQVAETTSDGSVRACRIHDLFREMIVRKSGDQNFTSICKQMNGTWSNNPRRISVHNSLSHVPQMQDFRQLRSLLLFSVEENLTKRIMPAQCYGDLKLLTVMDLQGASLKTFPTAVLKLCNLRYINLKGTKVRIIPSSISKLRKLETLKLKGTNVSRLPIEIYNLKQLRYLTVYLYTGDEWRVQGFKAGGSIVNLQCLQKLCFVKAGEGTEDVVRGLGMLTQLRRLGIIELTKKNASTLCLSIEKLRHLQALSIRSSETDTIDLQALSNPPKSLQRLYLTCKLETMPNWIMSLEKLVKVCLRYSRLKNDPVPLLEQLPNLGHLRLLKAYEGKALCFKAGKFRKLSILGLYELDWLEDVTVEEDSMTNLVSLTIWECSSLMRIPAGINNLFNLNVLQLRNMPEQLITRIQPPPVEGEDYKRVQHIRKVTLHDMKNGVWEKRLLTGMHQCAPVIL